jgi:NDP-sugar pyrophosphorylase family protein
VSLDLDGMILAAGRGTRLGELGQTTPKALIEVGGMTMLERTARKLVASGVTRLVVNVHHHAEAIEQFLAAHDLGAEVRVSRELAEPLETGGGLYAAREQFRLDRPILVHNVDVVFQADLAPLLAAHTTSGALATLAMQARESQRYLLFDEQGLFGRDARRTGVVTHVREPRGDVQALAFAGLHVCSPEWFGHVSERGVFPIVETWLRQAGEGHTIRHWIVPEGAWLEIGNPDRLAAVRAQLEG